MKLHIEAQTRTHHEGVTTLEPDEVVEYMELGSDDERREWLENMAREIVWGTDHELETEIVDVTWVVEEGDE